MEMLVNVSATTCCETEAQYGLHSQIREKKKQKTKLCGCWLETLLTEGQA